MTADRETDQAAPPPPAILLLAAGKHDAALAAALEAAGFRADIAQDPKELAPPTGRAGYDIVVLDLTERAGKPDLLVGVERVLAGVSGRPQVIVVGSAEGRCGHLVDLELAPGDTAGAARAIAGAIAMRRLRSAEEEVERLRKTILFARQTAHDLAQPLTTILARAQLLRLSTKPEDPHHRAVNIICDEADRLAKLLEEFQKLKVMAQGPARP